MCAIMLILSAGTSAAGVIWIQLTATPFNDSSWKNGLLWMQQFLVWDSCYSAYMHSSFYRDTSSLYQYLLYILITWYVVIWVCSVEAKGCIWLLKFSSEILSYVLFTFSAPYSHLLGEVWDYHQRGAMSMSDSFMSSTLESSYNSSYHSGTYSPQEPVQQWVICL